MTEYCIAGANDMAATDRAFSLDGMQVLVVGGNGFLGSHIVDALVDAGARVRVLAPQQESFRAPNPLVEYIFGRSEIGANLDLAVQGCDAVIDAVSMAVPATADASPATAICGAIGATAWLAELSRASSTVTAMLTLSSGGTVYGPSSGDHPHHETEALSPLGAYGALKAGSELAVSGILHGTGVRPISLRVSNAYGERQNPTRPQGIIAVAFARMRARQPLMVFGDTVRDYIHASDVASAVVCCLASDVTDAVNVGSGVGVALSDLLRRIEAVAGEKLLLEARDARIFDVRHSALDTTKLRSLGWAPSVELNEGLDRTWRWLREQPFLN